MTASGIFDEDDDDDDLDVAVVDDDPVAPAPPLDAAALAHHAHVKELFFAALEVPAADRSDLVRQADVEETVRVDVKALLVHHVPASPIVEAPPPPPSGDRLQLVGQTIEDRFAVEAFVAEGGFGYVYRARRIEDGARVALKLFKPALSSQPLPAQHAAFNKEGALLADLSTKSDAIVRCFEVGVWNGVPFLVLEWLQGRTLAVDLAGAAGTRWPLVEVMKLLRPVALALAVAHRSGVAHRDVKPLNIFVVDGVVDGRDGVRLKLLDFGVAKVESERARGFASTGTVASAFSLRYAAPEQIARENGSTGPWTDVYALASLCVELLIGKRAAPEDVLARSMNDVPVPPLGTQPAVQAVFAKALSRDPRARFNGAGPFWAALEMAA